MSRSRSIDGVTTGGFTLVELLVVLLVMTILASGLAWPIAAQVNARRTEAARRQLDDARDALLGFAATHGRLPCPAAGAGDDESFAVAGDAGNGECAVFAAWLPAAAIGLAAGAGTVRDPWEQRLRYAVASLPVNGIARPFTRANGMQAASLPALGAAAHFLFVCASGQAATASGCGPASAQLTRRAVFVVLSTGANGARVPGAGTDEARNVDGNAVFVAREPGADGNAEFDDLVSWVGLPLLAHRLLAAGRLP
jgi:prepilin-type N-terminal cleavage/methylation domain-containing protein